MPDFGRYWTKPWPHHRSDGVGLHFVGRPSDPTRFLDVLMYESCNPVAARRILGDLLRDGERKVTVMGHLPFERIGDAVALLDVTMHIVEPISEINDQHVDQAVMMLLRRERDENEEVRPEVRSALAEMQASLEAFPGDFAPYEKPFLPRSSKARSDL